MEVVIAHAWTVILVNRASLKTCQVFSLSHNSPLNALPKAFGRNLTIDFLSNIAIVLDQAFAWARALPAFPRWIEFVSCSFGYDF